MHTKEMYFSFSELERRKMRPGNKKIKSSDVSRWQSGFARFREDVENREKYASGSARLLGALHR